MILLDTDHITFLKYLDSERPGYYGMKRCHETLRVR